jgi:hypothetical protein
MYGEGILTTLGLLASSLVVGGILALAFALALTGPSKSLQRIVGAYTFVMRGTPLLIQIYMISAHPARLPQRGGDDAACHQPGQLLACHAGRHGRGQPHLFRFLPAVRSLSGDGDLPLLHLLPDRLVQAGRAPFSGTPGTPETLKDSYPCAASTILYRARVSAT